MRFSWDNSKNELLIANVQRGGIGFESVLQILGADITWPLEMTIPSHSLQLAGWVSIFTR
jgi:hypothetical protein